MAGEKVTGNLNARALLVDALQLNIVGPSAPDEFLDERPHLRYVAGHISPERDEDETEADPEATLSGEIDIAGLEAGDASSSSEASSIARTRRSSLTSIGISFTVLPGAEMSARVEWGEYATEGGGFRRTQQAFDESVTIRGPMPLTWREMGRARLGIIARQSGEVLICSVFVSNNSKSTETNGTERLYQVALQLKGVAGSKPFVSRAASALEEASTDDLLYRSKLEYGSGLHSAVFALEQDGTKGRCGGLRTVALPCVERPIVVPGEFENGEVLSMRYLASASAAEVSSRLRSAFSGYETWRSDIAGAAAGLPKRFQYAATKQIAAIDARISRILRGIEILRTNEDAHLAFQFANEAMGRAQFRRAHERADLGASWDEAVSGTWFPFQLAFLLGILPELVDGTNPDRALVDVLFFPTGGGKTEAYLGITSFVLAYRRFANVDACGGAGTAVLLRYTLRLLTTQQFERGARLIAACELIRRKGLFRRDLGIVPFSVGLWVGPMTPSGYDDAVSAIQESYRKHSECELKCPVSMEEKIAPSAGKPVADVNVRILSKCPWCYSPLCPACVEPDPARKRILTICMNVDCAFSTAENALPMWFVDADVYRECPSLLISTVDKFAVLPYRGEAKGLFGLTMGYCPNCGFLTDGTTHRKGCKGVGILKGQSPGIDVVIQDELHTITDTIGSAYGFYETAVEYLMKRVGRLPKYICATATVKDVDRQVRGLYGGRRSAVFPPVGIDAGDTYFSRELDATGDRPGRQYVGIYAPTNSRLTTFVAVLAALFSAASGARNEFGAEAADPYLTVLGYFNTIRDLGGVKSLVGDDVPPAVAELCRRSGWPPRSIDNWELELTGRIEADEVAKRLQLLETSFTDSQDGADFVAATNMISVGVDVDRLGLMAVDGQPKTTAEYIQATSRVGRKHPGLVVVVYNAMRPRDVSHFEHFQAYHSSYYRFVEAGSVTPFSDGCVERFSAGGFVMAYRLGDAESGQAAANRFKHDVSGERESICQFFEERAALHGAHEGRSIRARTDEITQVWATDPRELRYSVIPSKWHRAPKERRLDPSVIAPPGYSDEPPALFTAPLSMRNVEASVPLKVRTNV